MKRWPVVIALLYFLTFLALTLPASFLVFLGPKEKIDLTELFKSWEYWAWLVVLALNPWALLLLPVDTVNKRPASQRSVFFQIAASGFLMSILIAGLAVAVSEAVQGEGSFKYTGWIFLGVLGLSWAFWAKVFSRWSRKMDPEDLIRRTCRKLFKGSALQLLVVVPCHIIARSREYCCAGFGTAIGLTCGLAVMLVSFGPGVFLLYAAHWKKLHPGAGATKP